MCSCSTPTSAPGACASSAPYDEPACRCPPSHPSSDERVIAGVCAGIAQTLAVDVTLVRLVFALLALAGGAGIVLYLALWAYARKGRSWLAVVLAVVAGGLLLSALGLSDRSVVGIALIARWPRARVAPGRKLPSGRTALLRRARDRCRRRGGAALGRWERPRGCSRRAQSRARCC